MDSLKVFSHKLQFKLKLYIGLVQVA